MILKIAIADISEFPFFVNFQPIALSSLLDENCMQLFRQIYNSSLDKTYLLQSIFWCLNKELQWMSRRREFVLAKQFSNDAAYSWIIYWDGFASNASESLQSDTDTLWSVPLSDT